MKLLCTGDFHLDRWPGLAPIIDAARVAHDLLDAGAARVTVEPDLIREDRARVQVAAVDELSELEWMARWAAAHGLDPEPLLLRTQQYLEGSPPPPPPTPPPTPTPAPSPSPTPTPPPTPAPSPSPTPSPSPSPQRED